jgi:VCBS repeat-containing protein
MTVAVNLSNNPDIDGILWGWAWGDGGAETLDFSFPTGTAEYTDNGYVQIDNFGAFNAAQQTAVRTVLSNAASFCNLSFTETTADFAVLRFANADAVNYTNDTDVAGQTGLHAIGTAEANPPELEFNGDAPFSAPYAQGDSWYGTGGYTNPGLGSFQFAAGIMHEIGHNLGLKHGHVTQDGHGVNFPMLPADHNSYEYSVMTYSQFPGDNVGSDNAPHHPTTFMQNDIMALQYMYGANYGASANNTDTVYTWSTATGAQLINGVNQGAPIADYVLMTIWDGGGTDTYSFSNYTTNLSVDLNPGQWIVLDTTSPASSAFQRANLGNDGAGGANYFARGNIANAQIAPGSVAGEARSLIENANGGSGNDTITGNFAANVLRGNGGNDTMNGGDGSDTAYYTGTRLQHLATLVVAGTLTIADQRGGAPNGTDTVSNFEFYRFDDGTFNEIEVLNRGPMLSPDAGSPHNLSEIPGTSGSNTLDQVSGSLSFTDPNVGDTHTASAALNSFVWSGGAAIPGATGLALNLALTGAMSAVISPDGTAGELDWQFALADRLVDFLALGETLTAVYDMTVADHHVGSSVSDSSTVQVTILFTGTNDAVVLGAGSVLSDSVTELPLVTGSPAIDSTAGAILFSDLDLNDRPTASIDAAGQTVTWQDAATDYTAELTAGQIAAITAAFTIAAAAGNTNDGTIDWHYDIVDQAIDFLAVGETITLTTPVIVDDHNGSTISPDIVVTLIGANDAPIAFADSNGIAKGRTLTVAADDGLIGNDTDPDIHDQDGLFVSEVNGSAANVGLALAGDYGSLTVYADGSYVYAAYKGGLPAKIVAQDTFSYTLADGNGGTDVSTFSVVVFNPGVDYQSGIDTTLNGGNGPDVLDGSFGGDTLIGGNGPDVLIAGDGNVMTGGNGPDTFLFRPEFGENTIADFDVKTDALQFDNSIFADEAAMFANATNTAAGVTIEGSTTDAVTLLGVTLADLHAKSGSFYFV